MTIVRLLLGIILAALSTSAALAGDVASGSKRLTIGSTGVLCYMDPCPWRGVVDLEDPTSDRLHPLWNGRQAPGLIASPADTRRILVAWKALRCLEIEGAIVDAATGDTPPVLRVYRIIGACA